MTIAIPIIRLDYEMKDCFSGDAADILSMFGGNDDLTYTVHISLPEGPKREALKNKIREALEATEADGLIELVEAHDYDISFYIDSW